MTQLVLSLFSGIGLLDMAFEEAGFCIVRGPDLLWGGDIRRFHPPAERFDGVIGGPPCQKFSTAGAIVGSEKDDLIPEFIRVFEAVRPAWAVMENVPQAIGHPAIPRDWFHFKLRDYDCGGHTSWVRAFWTWPFMALVSPRAAGDASHSVMASTHKRGGGQYAKDKGFLPGNLPIAEYARLQGVPEIGRRLVEFNSSRAFAIHVLGNGVPLAMGRAVARAVAQSIKKEVVA
ncbi:DNA (cytosine-5)-methyltransferase 1 [Sinorhizobium meliloti]|nr:DNA cytosine methyltransferase [Sinorhizobium meliloti]WQP26292.1 DNA cytosine methyltransferase [Sinorhizobium meliloti]